MTGLRGTQAHICRCITATAGPGGEAMQVCTYKLSRECEAGGKQPATLPEVGQRRKIECILTFHVTHTSPEPFLAPALRLRPPPTSVLDKYLRYSLRNCTEARLTLT
jgi:hypothetical protein